MVVFEVNAVEKISHDFMIGVKAVNGQPTDAVGTNLLDTDSGSEWTIVANASLPPDSLRAGLRTFMVSSLNENAEIKTGCKLKVL